MAIFFEVMLLVVWLIAVVALGFVALEQLIDHGDPLLGGAVAVAAIVLLAGGVAFAVSRSGASDSRLCLSGHQEWTTTHGVAPVGKVIVPTSSTHKVWVCDKWEAGLRK